MEYSHYLYDDENYDQRSDFAVHVNQRKLGVYDELNRANWTPEI